MSNGELYICVIKTWIIMINSIYIIVKQVG
jgi:hypothetical protein